MQFLGIFFLIPLVCLMSIVFIRYFLKLLYQAHIPLCFSSNYKGKNIPSIGGVIYLPILFSALALYTFFYPKLSFNFLEFLFLAGSIGFSGLLDDLIGDKQIKGIKKHVRSTLNGNLTTGFIKAFMTGLASIIISIQLSGSIAMMLINLLLMLFFTNLLNLLDLRPGRSIKAFYFLSFPLVYYLLKRDPVISLPYILMGLITLFYLPYDLKEVCMLGDTGSNILGMTLGYYYAITAPLYLKLALLVFLIGIHLAAEKISLSKLIEKNRVLAYLDELGRSTAADDEYQPRRC